MIASTLQYYTSLKLGSITLAVSHWMIKNSMCNTYLCINVKKRKRKKEQEKKKIIIHLLNVGYKRNSYEN